MEVGEKFFDTKYGKMCYLETGSGKKVFVFFHGYWDVPVGVKYLAPLLEPLGYRVVAPYMPGHGKSFAIKSGFGFIQARDVLLDFLEQVVGNKPMVLFGSSMGGAYAIAVAQKRKVAGLILNDALVERIRVGDFGRKVLAIVDSVIWDKLIKRPNRKNQPSVDLPRMKRCGLLTVLRCLPMVMTVELDLGRLKGVKVLNMFGRDDRMIDTKLLNFGKVRAFPGKHFWFLHQFPKMQEEIRNFVEEL